MDLIFEVIKAFVISGIPVGVFSFLMFYFAYKKSYLSTDIEIKHAFKNKNDAHSTLSKKHKKSLLFLHSKWATFGGGFYGLIALITFVVIELTQIINFWLGVRSLNDIFDLFSISALIGMFVDSILNMVKSVLWFTYWPSQLSADNFILWILVAYVSYRIGAKYAKCYVLIERERLIMSAQE